VHGITEIYLKRSLLLYIFPAILNVDYNSEYI